jgi:hypothetical protein
VAFHGNSEQANSRAPFPRGALDADFLGARSAFACSVRFRVLVRLRWRRRRDSELGASPPPRRRVYALMGYIIAIVIVLLVIPLIFMMLSRRTTTGGGIRGKLHRGDVTVSQPSSDEPTPGADQTVREQKSGNEPRIPPG